MTVAELIQQLQKEPPEKQVALYTTNEGGYCGVLDGRMLMAHVKLKPHEFDQDYGLNISPQGEEFLLFLGSDDYRGEDLDLMKYRLEKHNNL